MQNQDTNPASAEDSTPISPQERVAIAIDDAAAVAITWFEEQRRWGRIRRVGLTLFFVVAAALWTATYLPMLGFRAGPSGLGVAVVPIEGAIGDPTGASADDVVPNILEACRAKTTKALVLRISSGGGSPSHAERMADALQVCRSREEGPVPVIAVIESLGASAAYLVASQADEVVANRYAQVGSIGAVWMNYDLTGVAERFGVSQRAFASGDLKTVGSPLQPSTAAQDEFLQEMVDGVAEQFRADVRSGRGDRLKDTPDLYSGRTWLAAEALDRGLIDEVATFDAFVEGRFPETPVYVYRPTRTLQEKLGLQSALENALRTVLTEAAAPEGEIR